MSDQPWVRWYASDFLNGVADLSPNEIAVYTIVLCRIYDEDAPIANDPKRIARRCNMREPQCKKAIAVLIEEGKLELVDGLLDNNRARKEREKRRETSLKQQGNAHKRWHEGSEKANKINDGPMPPHPSGIANGMPIRSQKLEPDIPLANANGSGDAADDDPEKALFEDGKKLLGKSAGGLIAKLIRARGVPGARAVIDDAADRQDPREWVGACIREDSADLRAKAWADRNREQIRREMEELQRAECV